MCESRPFSLTLLYLSIPLKTKAWIDQLYQNIKVNMITLHVHVTLKKKTVVKLSLIMRCVNDGVIISTG